jgi:hypothetical protein
MTEQERLEKEAWDYFGYKGEPGPVPEPLKEAEVDWDVDLNRFTGTGQYHRHWLGGVYTDGVAFLAEKAGAYWLIDLIESWQSKPKVRSQPFQSWTLKVDVGTRTGLAVCDDGNGNKLCSQKIPYTDFPLPVIKLYRADGVLLLPLEY